MYSMSTLTCLIIHVIAKGVYTTKQVAYCKRKLDNFYCDDKQNSIIFRLNNKYLQWICYILEDPLGQPYFRVISRVNNENATAASHKPDNITHMFTSTTTPVLAVLSRTENNAIIICNCVLFLLVLLVWIILYLKHFRQRKQDTTLKKRTSSTRQEETLSTRQEQTSATSQSPRTSNYEQISEVIISRPFHITNETYSDTCVPE